MARTPASARSGTGQAHTLGQQVAAQVEAEILRMNYPVGHVLGSEAELMARYDVSRSVFREAMRILASRSLVRGRPGPGGGLLVTAPSPDVVRDVARLLLEFDGLTLDNLYDTWISLECASVALLAVDLDPAGLEQLRDAVSSADASPEEMVAGRTNFSVEVARLTGNPVSLLFTQIVTDLAFERGVSEVSASTYAWFRRAHNRVVDAVAARDAPAATAAVRDYLERMRRSGALAPRPGERRDVVTAPVAAPASR